VTTALLRLAIDNISLLLLISWAFRYCIITTATINRFVDLHMNCEDVAMQLLVSNVSGLPPIYVRGAVSR